MNMKYKSLFLVGLLLLAIITIGAVSATDALAADDSGGIVPDDSGAVSADDIIVESDEGVATGDSTSKNVLNDDDDDESDEGDEEDEDESPLYINEGVITFRELMGLDIGNSTSGRLIVFDADSEKVYFNSTIADMDYNYYMKGYKFDQYNGFYLFKEDVDLDTGTYVLTAQYLNDDDELLYEATEEVYLDKTSYITKDEIDIEDFETTVLSVYIFDDFNDGYLLVEYGDDEYQRTIINRTITPSDAGTVLNFTRNEIKLFPGTYQLHVRYIPNSFTWDYDDEYNMHYYWDGEEMDRDEGHYLFYWKTSYFSDSSYLTYVNNHNFRIDVDSTSILDENGKVLVFCPEDYLGQTVYLYVTDGESEIANINITIEEGGKYIEFDQDLFDFNETNVEYLFDVYDSEGEKLTQTYVYTFGNVLQFDPFSSADYYAGGILINTTNFAYSSVLHIVVPSAVDEGTVILTDEEGNVIFNKTLDEISRMSEKEQIDYQFYGEESTADNLTRYYVLDTDLDMEFENGFYRLYAYFYGAKDIDHNSNMRFIERKYVESDGVSIEIFDYTDYNLNDDEAVVAVVTARPYNEEIYPTENCYVTVELIDEDSNVRPYEFNRFEEDDGEYGLGISFFDEDIEPGIYMVNVTYHFEGVNTLSLNSYVNFVRRGGEDDGIIIFVDGNKEFPTTGENVDDWFASITVPRDYSGFVLIEGGDDEYFKYYFNEFPDNKIDEEDEDHLNYLVSPQDVNFFDGLDDGDEVRIIVHDDERDEDVAFKKYAIHFGEDSFSLEEIGNYEGDIVTPDNFFEYFDDEGVYKHDAGSIIFEGEFNGLVANMTINRPLFIGSHGAVINNMTFVINSNEVTIRDLKFVYTGYDPVITVGGEGFTIDNNEIIYVGEAPVAIALNIMTAATGIICNDFINMTCNNASYAIFADDGSFVNCNGNIIYIESDTAVGIRDDSEEIKDNQIFLNANYAVGIVALSGAEIEGNEINILATDTDSTGIEINSDTTVSFNRIDSTGKSISILGGSSAIFANDLKGSINVENSDTNLIYNNNINTDEEYGVVIINSNEIAVTQNNIYANGKEGNDAVSSDNDNNIIFGNNEENVFEWSANPCIVYKELDEDYLRFEVRYADDVPDGQINITVRDMDGNVETYSQNVNDEHINSWNASELGINRIGTYFIDVKYVKGDFVQFIEEEWRCDVVFLQLRYVEDVDIDYPATVLNVYDRTEITRVRVNGSYAYDGMILPNDGPMVWYLSDLDIYAPGEYLISVESYDGDENLLDVANYTLRVHEVEDYSEYRVVVYHDWDYFSPHTPVVYLYCPDGDEKAVCIDLYAAEDNEHYLWTIADLITLEDMGTFKSWTLPDLEINESGWNYRMVMYLIDGDNNDQLIDTQFSAMFYYNDEETIVDVELSYTDDYTVIEASLIDSYGYPVETDDLYVAINGGEAEKVSTDKLGKAYIRLSGNATVFASYLNKNGELSYDKIKVVVFYDTEELIEQIENLTEALNNKTAEIENLNETVNNQSATIAELNETIKTQDEIIDGLIETALNQSALIKDLNDTVNSQAATITDLNDTVNSQAATIAELNDTIGIQNETIDDLIDMSIEQIALINDLNDTVNSQAATIAELNDTVNTQNGVISELNNTVNTQSGVIDTLNNTVNSQSELIDNLTETVTTQEGIIDTLLDEVSNQSALISTLNETVTNQSAAIQEQADLIDALNQALIAQNNTINQLMEIVSELNKTRSATTVIAYNLTTTAYDSSIDGKIGDNFTAKLVDGNGNPLFNKTVQVGLNGRIFTRTTDENGMIYVQMNTKIAGRYTFAVSYLGDDDYNASFAVVLGTVNKQAPKLSSSSKSFKSSAKTKTLTATFKTASNNPVKGKTIKFKLNGRTYSATTDSNGVAKVNISLSKKGSYSCTVSYAGDDTYKSTSKKITVKIT